MFDPISILGMGTSLISGLMGSSAEKKAADANREIAKDNLKWEREQFYKMLEIASRQEAEGKLGYTDANGNRVSFVEGKGWVTDLSPQQKLLQEYYQAEERNQLQQDLPAKRQQVMANLIAQGNERQYADALLTQMKGLRPDTPDSVESIRNALSAEGINKGMDNALEISMRNAMRTGSSNAGDIAAKIGSERGDQLRKAFMENKSGAADEAYNRYATKVGNIANLYNTFATRASGLPPTSYQPRNIEGQTQNLLTGAAGAGAQASANMLNANNSKNTPQLNFKEPTLYGPSKTIAGLGTDLYNLGGGMNFGGNYSGSTGTSDRYGPWGDSWS